MYYKFLLWSNADKGAYVIASKGCACYWGGQATLFETVISRNSSISTSSISPKLDCKWDLRLLHPWSALASGHRLEQRLPGPCCSSDVCWSSNKERFTGGQLLWFYRWNCLAHSKTWYWRVAYNGHKRVHGLNFQSVTLPNGLIGNIFGPVGEYFICIVLDPLYPSLLHKLI